ncbi:histidine kinase [Streptosporangium sp. NBC_01755]|uniref:sensor histidine kinase n=1 Tax=unclassified Streptosporangium TaxID=2632669 RepID=UPI002DDB3475|nr:MULTISPECIES: ATP-binding protein [unclassified Streptosporangium]WSA23243.1 histidine kinase [Streptosporangium sp. NBC_01810]WSC98619.1 histidine kinase [Streptosporangium sp. NBC_01755]
MLRRLLGDWRPTWLDLLLSLAVGITGLVESFGRQGSQPGQISDPVPLAVGAVVAGTLLLLRRRFPTALLLALISNGLAVRVVAGDEYYAAWHFYSTLILVHTVASAAELRSRRGIAGLACVLATYAGLQMQTFQSNDIAEVMITAVFIGVAYGSGILLRRQIDRTLRLAEHAIRLEMEREERARLAVAEERTRIARELHDIVSHNVSVMTLHTGGVRMRLGEEHKRERDMLLGVERAGREAVEELQLMLGVLRGTGDPDPGASQPGLERLDELVAQVREAGLDVRLQIIGEPRPLPPGLALSAYRVIQEALTNVLKHSPATGADVVIAHGPTGLDVEITDDGTGVGPPPAGGHGPDGYRLDGQRLDGQPSGGHGLVGMRERTEMHGGELSTGPVPGGGYRVAARFPLDISAATG